ncbi:MAG: 6,7-dimethyl-8-ribityllumazine synthase [Rhodospirillaceae bacterium]|nr:6,7-dimethyl-8-ribityllumazine synthase [Rhodospirillaceae bacterium]
MLDHKKKILLVCSPYYKDITSNLIKGASDFLKSKSVDYKILNVPGALEIAPAIKLISDRSIKKPIFDGYLALGCVIRGETYHFEIVANESSRALSDLSINYSIPIGNGILTVSNKEQAIVRSDPNQLNKGAGAAEACLSLVNVNKSIEYE